MITRFAVATVLLLSPYAVVRPAKTDPASHQSFEIHGPRTVQWSPNRGLDSELRLLPYTSGPRLVIRSVPKQKSPVKAASIQLVLKTS